MNENRSNNKVAIIAFLLSIIAITGLVVGYATFSTTLTINGTAKAKQMKWHVYFENLQQGEMVGKAVEKTAPQINADATTIETYDVEFSAPGDKAIYTFDITNDGSYDAKITSINIPTPTATDEKVQSNLTYTLTYAESGEAVAVGDVLETGDTKTVKLTLAYSENVTVAQLPVTDVTISNLTASVTYTQQ